MKKKVNFIFNGQNLDINNSIKVGEFFQKVPNPNIIVSLKDTLLAL